MDSALLEQLLYQEESDSLDFKRDQYPFEGGTNEEKGELLKDILAFANSWRREDGYILIGVEEIKGGKSVSAGVSKHLDDAKLQQFINSKTQRPVIFSYIPFVCDSKEIGIIRIPVQERPIYSIKDYGRVKKDIVYVRRSSSTDTASPEEIIRMGTATKANAEPTLALEFADPIDRTTKGASIKIVSEIIRYEIGDIPSYGKAQSFPYPVFTLENTNYYRELAIYFSERAKCKPVHLLLKNLGSTLASNVRVKISSEVIEGFSILDKSMLKSYPSTQSSFLNPRLPNFGNFSVKIFKNNWTFTGSLGSLQPKDQLLHDEAIYLGSDEPMVLNLEALIFADNLPEPIKVPLLVEIEVAVRDLLDEDLGL